MSGGNALHDLIRNGSIREALDLINSGSWLEEKDDQERTSLILAVREGYVDIVKALIHKGANLNHKDKYGRTALHYAALSGSEEISKMLIEAQFAGFSSWPRAGSARGVKWRWLPSIP